MMIGQSFPEQFVEICLKLKRQNLLFDFDEKILFLSKKYFTSIQTPQTEKSKVKLILGEILTWFQESWDGADKIKLFDIVVVN